MSEAVKTLLAESLIRDVPDFPRPGILFKDITPILSDPTAFAEIISEFSEVTKPLNPDLIVGIESRGFLFGAPLALKLGLGFVPIRKAGKLPFDVISGEYELEYGSSVIEIHRDAITQGQRVIIIDDLLATGGTAKASIELAERLGGTVVAAIFLIELGFLNGREDLAGYKVESLITF